MKKSALHSSGIAAAKRRYWSKVRSNWNKEKRKRSKSYTVLLERQELKAVQRAAKQQQISGTRFIKAAALHVAGQGTMVNKATLGEVRQITTAQSKGMCRRKIGIGQ
jgi:hypothetical protein